jgi:glycerol kinase
LTTIAAMTDAKPKYALEGAVFIAGAAVQWLRDGLRLFTSSAEVERLARESNPAEPVLFVPGLVGLGAPHWVPQARGVIFGLTRATTAADFGRAALEGVAFQVADLIDAADHDLGGAPDHAAVVKVDGGMTANDWFLQFQADVLGRPVARAAMGEATALGAAFLAAVGAGLADETKLAAVLSAAAAHFEPKIPSAVRDQKLAAWRKAVKAVVAFYSSTS